MPKLSASSSARGRSMEEMATTFTPGTRRSASTWAAPMNPEPTIATLIDCIWFRAVLVWMERRRASARVRDGGDAAVRLPLGTVLHRAVHLPLEHPGGAHHPRPVGHRGRHDAAPL